jgi:ABC-type cobalamin transport system permease subunit
MTISPRVLGVAMAFVQGYLCALAGAIAMVGLVVPITASLLQHIGFGALAGGFSGIVNYLRTPAPK